MEQPRLLYEDAEDGEEYVRTDEEKNELREKILLGVNNFIGELRIELLNRKRRFMECSIEIKEQRIKSKKFSAR